MYRVSGWRLGPDFAVRSVVEKNHFWLTVEKMFAFTVFTNTYLRPYGCSSTNFTATVNRTYPKTKIPSSETTEKNALKYLVFDKTNISLFVSNKIAFCS